MSASTPKPPAGGAPKPAAGAAADPSMEDILASIRRILSDDEAEQAAPPAAAAPLPPPPKPVPAPMPDREPEVLDLDAAMIVDEPAEAAPHHAPPETPAFTPPPAAPEPPMQAASPPPPPEPPPAPEPAMPEPSAPIPVVTPGSNHLVAPEAAAAAASSVGQLLRTLVAGREQVAVHRGGPTIEDLVREEIRPLLKEWLDANLPVLVERLVRAEIERVVSRAIS